MKFFHKTLVLLVAMSLLASCSAPAIERPHTEPYLSDQTLTPETETEDLNQFVLTPENVRNIELVNTHGEGWIKAFALSPDGTQIAYTTITGIYLHDIPSNETKQIVAAPELFWAKPSDWPPASLSFTPDGKELAFAKESIRFINLDEVVPSIKDAYIQKPSGGQEISEFFFLGDGSRILIINRGMNVTGGICAGISSGVQLLDRRTGRVLFSDFFCKLFGQAYQLTPENKLILPGWDGNYDMRGQALVIDPLDGSIISIIDNPTERGWFNSINEVGTQALISKYRPDRSELIELDSGDILYTFSFESTHLAGSEYLLELNSGNLNIMNAFVKKVCTINAPEDTRGYIFLLYPEIQNYRLAYLDDSNGINVIDIKTCQPVLLLKVEAIIDIEDFSIDEMHLGKWHPHEPEYTIENENQILFFDNFKLKLCKKDTEGLVSAECSPAYDTRGLYAYQMKSDMRLVPLSDGHSYAILDMEDGSFVQLQRFLIRQSEDYRQYQENKAQLNRFTFSPNNKLFAATSPLPTSDKVMIWDVSSGNLLIQLELPEYSFWVFFSTDGTKFYALSNGALFEFGLPQTVISGSS